MGLHWVVHTSRINSQSFNRRCVCQVHFTKINFGNRSPKAVGHSFQKIYHGCFVNLKVWPTDQQRPKNPGSRVASSAGEPLRATVIQTRWTVTNPSYSNGMILTPSGPIHYCPDGLQTVRTVWKLSGLFRNCPYCLDVSVSQVFVALSFSAQSSWWCLVKLQKLVISAVSIVWPPPFF